MIVEVSLDRGISTDEVRLAMISTIFTKAMRQCDTFCRKRYANKPGWEQKADAKKQKTIIDIKFGEK
jgi:hypothetical protein